jgi:alpha-D-xyloside xylohydrolase
VLIRKGIIMKLLKYSTSIIITALSLTAAAVLTSCTDSTGIKINAHSEDDFPEIRIKNNAGKDIVICAASPSTGSIGYKKNGVVTWVRGEPARSRQDGDVFTWDAGAGSQVKMYVTRVNDDMDFRLSLAGGKDTADKWYINIKAEDDEYFTGLLERVVDGHQDLSWQEGISTALNLRGEFIEMKIKPTVSAYAPFYISSENYGFFVKGTWPGTFDLCRELSGLVQVAFEGPDFSFRLYRGSSPGDIVQRHALETGPSFLPPVWAFGPWRWRDDHVNRTSYYDSTKVMAPFNSELVEDILLMGAYDIPFSAYWIDRPWCKGIRGFDDYEFDTVRFPRPGDMVKWINGKGAKLMIWIAPFVMGDMAGYAKQKGYHLVSRTRENYRQVLIDFTNPDACLWWSKNGPGKLAAMGISGFKLDRGDGEKLVDSLHLITHNGTSYRENYNDYVHQYVKATYKAVQPVLDSSFILFPRGQYTGSARHGGMWAGDTDGKPEGLRSAIIGMQRCAIMGYPLWGSDIGGYWGTFSRETCMRWLGFGCFCPLMETGPTNNRGFWDNPGEPHYDIELIAVWRLYSKIRTMLVPYLHGLAREASETGKPVIRPLFIAYPGQEQAWNDWQTYMLGPDILVSAIWEKGKVKHTLYLPSGEEWTDAWDTTHTYKGGQYIEVNAPLYKIPVFIRNGSGISLGNLNELYRESLEIASQRPDLSGLEIKEGWR